jgi:hypothetical protein
MDDFTMIIAIMQQGYNVSIHKSDLGISIGNDCLHISFDSVQKAYDFIFN